MTIYEYHRMLLIAYLGTYRNAEPHIRRFVNHAISISLRNAKTEEEKRLHNLLVLQFIAEQPLSVNKICKALHMGRSNFKELTQKSIDRLMVLLFGVDGIDWGS